MNHTLPSISVIVPVYNAEKYLDKCVESLLSQSFADFELLLVNDGSTDNSGKLCDEYAKKDRRIKVFHKENGGVSSARNVALDHANGQWIAFVDSDDWVSENYLKDLHFAVVGEKKGLIFQGFSYYKNGKITESLEWEDETIQKEDVIKLFEEKKIRKYGYSCSKLYNMAVIKEYNLRFDETLKIAEDLMFLLSYLPHIDYVRFISGANYFYRSVVDSLSKKHFSYQSMYEVYEKSIPYMDALFKDISDPGHGFFYPKHYRAELLMGTIFVLYAPENITTRKERLSVLKTLSENDRDTIIRSFYHRLFILRVNKFLLEKRLFAIFDIYNLCVFYIRGKLFSHRNKLLQQFKGKSN